MKLSDLKNLAEQDMKALANSRSIVDKYKKNIDVFKGNADEVVNELNYYLKKSLLFVLSNYGFTTKASNWSYLHIEGSDISIQENSNDPATPIKLRNNAQIIIKRGSLQNKFSLTISHEHSDFFEFAHEYERFYNNLGNKITIDQLNLIKKHQAKMDEHKQFTTIEDMRRKGIDEKTLRLNFRGNIHTAGKESLKNILEEMVSLATCLKDH